MSNNRYNNQANPFWDFLASLQDASNQPAFGQQRREPQHEENEGFDHFDNHWVGAGPWGSFGGAQRGRRHGPHGHGHGRGPRGGRDGSFPPEHEGPEHAHEHHGPPHEGHMHPRGPPPPHHEGGPSGPPRAHGPPPAHDEARGPPPPPFVEDPPSRAPTPPTPAGEAPQGGPHSHHGGPPPPPHHPRHGGPFGGRGEHSHGPGHGGRGGHRHGRGRGGPHGGPRGPFFPRFGGPSFTGGAPFDLNALAEAFAPGLFASGVDTQRGPGAAEDGTFNPEIDVFDTPAAYIVHASLPGAKKSDLSITYSAARSSVCISGVVTRPGVDEEMMAALALDERKVGSFEREVKLEKGVQIDEDSIAAKLEEGVLRVTVPKVQMLEDSEEDYVDVKKVELE